MIERREFLKKIALVAGVMGGGSLLPASGKAAEQEIGIAVVEGKDPASQVREAIRMLGGIQDMGLREFCFCRPARRATCSQQRASAMLYCGIVSLRSRIFPFCIG